MNEVTLPPSPNWFLSTTLACTKDGTVAWGSKNSIIIGKRQAERQTLSYVVIPDAHHEKINSLAFCPDYGMAGKNLLVTGGNDCVVKVWDVDKVALATSVSYDEVDQKVAAVDWSRSNPGLICAVSTQGSMLTWQINFRTRQVANLSKMTATCMSCSPHNPNLIAIGTKSGIVHITNLQGKTLHRLRGHDHDIVALSWCPTPVNIFKEDLPKDYLLASSAKDRSIFIWRAGTDGRSETELQLPSTPQDTSQHRAKSQSGPFTVVLWIEPGILLAGSQYGELLSLRLATTKRSTRNSRLDWRIVHGKHSRAIFSISSYVEPLTGEELKPSDDANWRSERQETVAEERQVWSTGQERQVVCSVPGKEENTWTVEDNIPTLGGFVYCLAPCPVDTARIALGIGDGMLRVWNLSEFPQTPYDIIAAWQDIKDRVTAVAWHPERENLLAYGTSAGRVGVYDIFNVSRRPVVFTDHHEKTIYRLQWGPDAATKSYALYCCGNGELTCFNYDKPQDAPKVILEKGCTDAAWKPDYSCLAVGHDNGAITFFNAQLKPCGKTIFHLKKPVECLAWHPTSTMTDLNFSHFRNYLATSTTNSTVTIFDMSGLAAKLSGDLDCIEHHRVIADLTGHSDRIFSLAWSPHISGYLVSGSADRTAQVWKIDEQKVIATYTGHAGGVQAVLWSPLDPNLIMTGSSDWFVRMWKYPDQPVVLPSPGSTKPKSRKTNKKSTARATETTSSASTDTASEGPVVRDNKEKKRPKKVVSYLPNYRRQMNDSTTFLRLCLDLAEQVNGTGISETLFGPEEAVSEILKIERQSHWENDHSLVAVEMSLWDNNLKETITEAMQTQSLSDFMVSLAPTVGVKFWKDACEAFANQLVQEGSHMKAASYLLGIGRIHEALEILRQANLLREAYAISRCRLDPEDEVVKTIKAEWLSYLVKTGAFEEAALCYIHSKELSQAASILSKRKDTPTLETAARLAKIDGNLELCRSIVEEALTILLAQSNYERAKDLSRRFSHMEYRLLQVAAYEEIRTKLAEPFDAQSVEAWLEGRSPYHLIWELRRKFMALQISGEDMLGFYHQLEAVSYPATVANQPESMTYMVLSRHLALAASTTDFLKMVKHIAAALAEVSHSELLPARRISEHSDEILIRLLAILENRSPSMIDSIFYFEDATVVRGVQRTLRAYMCLGLTNFVLNSIVRGQMDNIPLDLLTIHIADCMQFALDLETVQHWMSLKESSKLLEVLARPTITAAGRNCIMERLPITRQIQAIFIEERVAAPNPLAMYIRALDLGNRIPDGRIKRDYMVVLNDSWATATNLPREE